MRDDDGQRNLQISIEQHFRNVAELFNQAVFDNGAGNYATHGDVFELPEEQAPAAVSWLRRAIPNPGSSSVVMSPSGLFW